MEMDGEELEETAVNLDEPRLIARFELAGEHFVAPTGRATVWLDTVAMFPDFPVVGCGYGTFAATYPIYRSADVRK